MDDLEANMEQDFCDMLVNLSHHIGEQDLEMMKFYCSPFVSTGRLSEITQVVQLWPALKEKELISPSDMSFLRQLFEKGVKRMDLLRIVDDFEQQLRDRTPTGPVNDPGFRKQLEFVAENVNVQKWRKLVRTLGLDDADIDNVVDQHRTNVRDQILQALLLWTRRCKEQATRTTLIDALNRAQLKLVADRLIDQYPV